MTGSVAVANLRHRAWKVSGRETHRATGNHPGQGHDAVFSGLDGGIAFLERAGLVDADVQDGQSAQVRCRVEQWPSGEQVSGLVEVGQVGHVRVLQGVFLRRRKRRSIRAEHEKRHGEPVKIHAGRVIRS
jgi:hypothetical protein